MKRNIKVRNFDKYIDYHEQNLKRSLKHDVSQKEMFDSIRQAQELCFEITIPKEVEKEIEKSIFEIVESITKQF